MQTVTSSAASDIEGAPHKASAREAQPALWTESPQAYLRNTCEIDIYIRIFTKYLRNNNYRMVSSSSKAFNSNVDALLATRQQERACSSRTTRNLKHAERATVTYQLGVHVQMMKKAWCLPANSTNATTNTDTNKWLVEIWLNPIISDAFRALFWVKSGYTQKHPTKNMICVTYVNIFCVIRMCNILAEGISNAIVQSEPFLGIWTLTMITLKRRRKCSFLSQSYSTLNIFICDKMWKSFWYNHSLLHAVSTVHFWFLFTSAHPEQGFCTLPADILHGKLPTKEKITFHYSALKQSALTWFYVPSLRREAIPQLWPEALRPQHNFQSEGIE